jgi:hypothetical protein
MHPAVGANELRQNNDLKEGEANERIRVSGDIAANPLFPDR